MAFALLKNSHYPVIVTNNRDLDPTQTIVLRQRFITQINKRFRNLKGAINHKLIDERYLDSIPLIGQADRRYIYRYADEKIKGFMEWLRNEEAKGILEMVPGPGVGFSRLGQDVPWTNTYIQSAYQKGIAHARADLRREGLDIPEMTPLPGQDAISAAFNAPFHSERVALVYTRAFNGMEGITAQMNTQISHVLASGMVEGRGINEIARGIIDRIQKLDSFDEFVKFGRSPRAIVRARMIARTEIVYAHNNATLNEFERIENFTGEKIKVRWFTARDERVREEHAARHNVIYTRKEAETLIGEPNCRCSLLPYISIHGNSIAFEKEKT
jgi:SPP1 gp7 family putative phage head morphogenesis protein